jgi:chemotaxis-related protein WspB
LLIEPDRDVERGPVVRPGQWLLHFEIPGLMLCLPLANVVRVLPLAALQPLPSAPAFVSGLLNLHGNPLSVVDLAVRLGQRRPARHPVHTPMLHCRQEAREGVLIVERVLGPRMIDEDGVGTSGGGESPASPFRGTVAIDARMSMLLDPSAVLSLDREFDLMPPIPVPVAARGGAHTVPPA